MNRAITPLVRRSVVATRARQSSLRGGASPPIPPFARNVAPAEKLYEQHDCVWDDGVAPEMALDFDCQHIPTWKGLSMWLGGLGALFGFYQFIKSTDPESKKPCASRLMDMVVESPRLGPPPPIED
mmetsp:Transcript_13167/g.27206  ORF Transcript_13167/g.27206 Transcript_13167/m.27206 type:complete len:126 (-) Transcript_13167:403-780(-)|eukprot:CAMPEP_0183307442 /NCGR_PEP_ID=MMETSP0160_2-20130417/17335_1 /TAXON_ID=2839 ORGANISM="Odontella Sinensis, Strain Grunow 1884" /NCGR_SAMPLE_ID=MMETSP0160_2 /ASSEMBLY_ACC=CAM_ASM_000250 /LENGTH=125 /DNA_ID=CAMNT_0025471027 /DNA_START=61 /DNA_END=438 /DNA_ORIENTATION=-